MAEGEEVMARSFIPIYKLEIDEVKLEEYEDNMIQSDNPPELTPRSMLELITKCIRIRRE